MHGSQYKNHMGQRKRKKEKINFTKMTGNPLLVPTSLTVIDWSLETIVSNINYMNVLFTFSPPTFFLSLSYFFMLKL